MDVYACGWYASNSPYDLYWPGNLDDSLPEDEQMVPQPHPPVYSSYDLKAMEDRELGGVCKGKLQRRGNQPLKCNKIDLEELDFTVRQATCLTIIMIDDTKAK